MTERRTPTPFASFTTASALMRSREEKDACLTRGDSFLGLGTIDKQYKESQATRYGIERCLYELNPELACLSPCLIHAAALTPTEALVALETVAMQPNRPLMPVDRHLAAFLVSRWKGMSFADLRDMSKPQREIKNLAVLRILAGIQEEGKIPSLPNLCQWMADLCAPMITQYHNLKVRARVQEEISQAIETGQLANLGRAFANRQTLTEDDSDFQAAKIEVLLIESEIKEIEARILNRNQSTFWDAVGVLGKLRCILFNLKNAHTARRGKIRIVRLYHRSETLRETWGDGLIPRAGNSSLDFWKKLWRKMTTTNSPRSSAKIHVDGWLKYD